MTPAIRRALAHLFDVEARDHEQHADLAEQGGWEDLDPGEDGSWRWEDCDIPPGLSSVAALRTEATRLRGMAVVVLGEGLLRVEGWLPKVGPFVAGAIVGPDGTLRELAPVLRVVCNRAEVTTARGLRVLATRQRWSVAYVFPSPLGPDVAPQTRP